MFVKAYIQTVYCNPEHRVILDGIILHKDSMLQKCNTQTEAVTPSWSKPVLNIAEPLNEDGSAPHWPTQQCSKVRIRWTQKPANCSQQMV